MSNDPYEQRQSWVDQEYQFDETRKKRFEYFMKYPLSIKECYPTNVKNTLKIYMLPHNRFEKGDIIRISAGSYKVIKVYKMNFFKNLCVKTKIKTKWFTGIKVTLLP
jgi:hypothetical protein